jgi:serum/glucocorticoid-regulated kinase 2
LIRVCEARGITPPAEITLPATQQVAINHGRNRDSLSRKQQNWWLPYVVLEFDKNEVLIDALGGDTRNPIYQYRAHLYVLF